MDTTNIETSRFGAVTINTDRILTFTGPILGFEQITRYVLLDHAPQSPFKWLQAMDDVDLAFVVTDPTFFGLTYEFAIPDAVADQLGITQVEEAMVFTIVNIPDDNPTQMTANLLAPIVMNQTNLNAMQVILQDPALSTRTRLIPDDALTASGKTGSAH
jgi:flagellar assembly factor FliW